MMKLNLLFLVMDLLTLLAYPILFVHGRLYRFSRSRENTRQVNISGLNTSLDDRLKIVDM